MTINSTKLKKVRINKFRGLKDIEVDIADRITIICGKNGTSKSTILGLIAQIFNFQKDYVLNEPLNYQTLTGKQFKSNFSEHFRFSTAFDVRGSMNVDYQLYDAYLGKEISGLRLELVETKDRKNARPVVRNNLPTESTKNTSRNVTHPLIYLSLKRLMPIAERSQYLPQDIAYLENHKNKFKSLSNKLLGKHSGSIVTATAGTVSSAVVHGDSYDHESVSAGEDNAGQILMALMSFQRLKDTYPNYHGGILLVDEADAGLFPAAQKELLNIFNSISKQLDIQIIFTTHSPIIIQDIFEKSQKDRKNFKTIYLTDTFGSVEKLENVSWDKIYADLNIETVTLEAHKEFPKTNVYFEDDEAFQFFNALIRDRKTRKLINTMGDITLGCKSYLDFIKRKIPEFSKNSVIVLDGDEVEGKAYKNVVNLPTDFPPDQLLFDFLYRLPDCDKFWRDNKYGFTKAVFNRVAQPVIDFLGLPLPNDQSYDLRQAVQHYVNNGTKSEQKGRTRDKFKAFYRSSQIQQMIKGKISENPFKLMIDSDPARYNSFAREFKEALAFSVIASHPSKKAFIKSYLDIG